RLSTRGDNGSQVGGLLLDSGQAVRSNTPTANSFFLDAEAGHAGQDQCEGGRINATPPDRRGGEDRRQVRLVAAPQPDAVRAGSSERHQGGCRWQHPQSKHPLTDANLRHSQQRTGPDTSCPLLPTPSRKASPCTSAPSICAKLTASPAPSMRL